jgi:hypothetical protein
MNVLLLLKETWDNQAKDGKTSTHKDVTSIFILLGLPYLEVESTVILQNSGNPSSMAKRHIPEEPSQAKVLTGGGDLRKAQVNVPLSVSHSCV